MRRFFALGLILACIGAIAGRGEAQTMKHPHPHVHPLRVFKHSQRYLNARLLARGLRGTPIARQAWVLEDIAYHDHINPFFIVGAAGTESSVWRASCPGNPKNGWGMSSCGSGWYVPYFRSWRQAFDFYARYIRRTWPSARTPYDLHGYCGCGDQAWGDKTVAWMRQLFGPVPIGLGYPA